MNNQGQGFNVTREGKLFKLSPSNFNFGTVARQKRVMVKALYTAAKEGTQFGPILKLSQELIELKRQYA